MYYNLSVAEVPIRELNQETAQALARVKRGEEVDITERGVVVARLVPAEPTPIGRLLATGNLRPPRTTGPPSRPKLDVRTRQQSDELLDHLRDEE